MYDIMSLGVKRENVEVIVNGITNAILMAYGNMKSGRILVNSGELVDPLSNINRSPSAYQNNPAAERAKYDYNVDKIFVTAKFEAEDGTELGAINWFPVHGTSMTNLNMLISGDNKGYASLLFEKYKNGNSSMPGTGSFVAAFTNCNEGDVTPNTRGAFCDNGLPCDYAHSTCGGTSENCHGYGPGKDDFESTKIIGSQQFAKAVELYENATTPLSGSIDYRHLWSDMEKVTVLPQFSGLKDPVQTCTAALGDSFAAGTTDGPGDFDFKQGSNSTKDNPFWNYIASFLADPPVDQQKCHFPKPILIYCGGVFEPTKWTANILPLQIVRIGQLYIVAVPAEFSTMAGRRLKESVKQALLANGASSDLIVVISGLSNAYSQYVTTPEEYAIQRYEGASTLFGPNTLPAYQQLYSQLATALQTNQNLPPGPTPTDYSQAIIDLQPGVVFDDGPIGTIITDVNPTYTRGQTASVTFYSANPRNNFRTQDTFLTVEIQDNSGSWKVVANDGFWETKFKWQRLYSIELGESSATIEWQIPADASSGTYR
eukprot:TRINITY_DN3677_c0_g1_i1.p1 TRINITY_DN3677_c0_g1~~TRINITY_DN3677_c0_g1_i1.p1  ORF type:complete len:543 (+),score=145.29 TRINITY_DN3677_c0_g1_i1:540-2168(+)